MSMSVLRELLSDEFELAVGFVGTPSAAHWLLGRMPQVRAIRQSLRQEALTDETIRRFASGLLWDLRRGERLPHELAIAALAVALEMRPTDFAEEFLRDLSRLKLAEMSLCIRVARECLARRVAIARTTERKFNARRPEEGEPPGNGCSSPRIKGSSNSAIATFGNTRGHFKTVITT